MFAWRAEFVRTMVFPHNWHTRPLHFLAGVILFHCIAFRYYNYALLLLTHFITYNAHCVPFIVQKGI